MNPATAAPVTPFETVGGRDGIARVVDRFYDLMDSDPAYRDLRALHAPDLEPVRASLAGFLTAWLGGPRDWLDTHPGKCMMSVHAPHPITTATADQWVHAMSRALEDSGVNADLADRINTAFASMATNMARTG